MSFIIDCEGKTTREINRALKDAIAAGRRRVDEPSSWLVTCRMARRRCHACLANSQSKLATAIALVISLTSMWRWRWR